ncbi:MAG: hypothetical protein N3C62_05350 [Synergistetes bacterium]|nr:hypothetical protein [Synergistota bacterium]MCX8128140.1 hypothetical protein [Synergistota bacterium]MDW8192516.1 hypothetical protein [Synergistota bacterium]
MKKKRGLILIGIIFLVFLTSEVYSREIGTVHLQPQVGSIVITGEDIKGFSETLKTLQIGLSELQKILMEIFKKIEASRTDLEPLREEILSIKGLLDGLRGDILKRLDEESKFVREEFLSKLDFLTTVMRRAMVVFKNVEDLTKEAQALKDHLISAGEELRKLTELSKREFENSKGTQFKIISLLIVNLVLLSFLVFLQLEKTFRKLSKEKGDEGKS